ncbi:MAG: glycosyltransferase family 39 protein [Flavobacteriales bacterium]|nr:glycosyltransferase family 39 protein [Flavobacteriales bacterium]
MDRSEKIILVLILLVAAALRIYNFWDFSLSNDELSALARLNFGSFRDLIMEGVRIDGHPPAAQVVLWYMTKWFGNSVFVVRLPFVLAGIASVYFMFRVAKEWISTSAGLLSSATFATLIFPVLYSRIARPYALGMLFALMAAFFWIRIVKEKHSLADYFLLALSLALCAYSHYFAAFVAAMLAISGTFLIKGRNLRNYLFALVGSFMLFLPYIPIFLHQLSLGGVGQWLGVPENDWLWRHIGYTLNESVFVLILVTGAGIAGFSLFKSKKSFLENGLPLLLFISPFLIGFAYSKYINPVLQNSTLLFSFPFLLIFIFSGWEDSKKGITKVVSIFLLLSISLSTVAEKNFFRTNHFGVFKELATYVSEWNSETKNNAVLIGDYNAPFYIDYYLNKLDSTQMSLYRVTDEKGMAKLKAIIDTSMADYLIYSWSTVNQAPEVEDIIRFHYPTEVKREKYFNSEVVMFGKGENPDADESFQFTKTEKWNLNPDKIFTDSLGFNRIVIDSESPYGPTFSADLETLRSEGVNTLVVLVEISQLSESSEVQMVYDQSNSSGGYAWESDQFYRQFSEGSPEWGVFHYDIRYDVDTLGTLKVYPWSPKGEVLQLSKMEIMFR